MEEIIIDNTVSTDSILVETKKKISEKEFKRLHRIATEVETSSNKLNNYIEDLKKDMLAEQGERPGDMDYSKMDKPSTILFKNKSERGKAFVYEIDLHKKNMLSKLEDFSYKTYEESINSWFNTKRFDGKDWLIYEFDDFPLIASYTKLTTMQSDIKYAQLLAYNLLLKE